MYSPTGSLFLVFQAMQLKVRIMDCKLYCGICMQFKLQLSSSMYSC